MFGGGGGGSANPPFIKGNQKQSYLSTISSFSHMRGRTSTTSSSETAAKRKGYYVLDLAVLPYTHTRVHPCTICVWLKWANQISWCKGVKRVPFSRKFHELHQSWLARCVTALNCDKVEMAQAKTGGLSCGYAEPNHGEGLHWGDESREQRASAC